MSKYGRILDKQSQLEDEIDSIDDQIRDLQKLKEEKEERWDVLDILAEKTLKEEK